MLPKGYLDGEGTLHREGVMRLARAIIELGTLETITPELLEGLFLADFLYLRQFYREING